MNPSRKPRQEQKETRAELKWSLKTISRDWGGPRWADWGPAKPTYASD